jgi:uncharacterized membrane protein YdbT with pleckstrin-like domain
VALPRSLLNDGEEIVLDLRPHWWFIAPRLAALIVSLILGLMLLVSDLPAGVKVIGGVGVLVCFFWFSARYLVWNNTHFIVTTERLISRHGVITKKGIQIPLQRVNTVHSSQTLFERLLRHGDLMIESAGQEGQQQFSDVRNPAAVQNEIYKQKEAKENRQFDRMSTGTRTGLAGDGIPGQIRALDELRKQGVLSDDEFALKKQQLLDRM